MIGNACNSNAYRNNLAQLSWNYRQNILSVTGSNGWEGEAVAETVYRSTNKQYN